MSYFTLTQIFPNVALSSEEVSFHKMMVGRSVKKSFQTRYPEARYDKTVEEDFQVILYPEYFKPFAEKVIKRYVKKHQLPLKQRKRILKTNQLVTV